ncbi:unnamed protein product, partial [Linum tenue]
ISLSLSLISSSTCVSSHISSRSTSRYNSKCEDISMVMGCMVLLASGRGTDLQSQFWLFLTCSNLMFEIVGGLIRFHQFWLLLTYSNSSSI